MATMRYDPRVMREVEVLTTAEENEKNIKELTEQLEHEKQKKECIKKLEALGFDIEILKEILR